MINLFLSFGSFIYPIAVFPPTHFPCFCIVCKAVLIFFDKSLEYISFNIDLKGAISLLPFAVSKVSIPSVTETYLTLFSGNHFSMYSPVSM